MSEISEQDEREALEWLRTLADKVTTKPVVSEHARTIIALLDAVEASQRETRTVPDDVVLTLVSQARQRARDAALEEAAQIAECNVFTGPDDSDPRIGEAHNGAVRWTAHLIRALRSKS